LKPKGQHPDKKLSAVKVRTLTNPGRYADGNGLYLVVDPGGAKRWVLRTVVRGRRRDIGLGSVRLVSLSDAREEAARLRRFAREGGDPLAERLKARATPTFEQAARRVHTDHAPSWRNVKHAAQWMRTLENHVFPVLGERRVDQIETSDVLSVLSPIWLTKPETARRVRQRMGVVFDWAATAGFRSTENPTARIDRGLPRQTDRKTQKHHAAMPYADVPAFVRDLRMDQSGEPACRLAFEFLIVTAARTGEVIRAKTEEIDLHAATWTLPADRMKTNREHRVPLPDRALEIVAYARTLAFGQGYLFASRNTGKPLSNMAFLMQLRRWDLPFTAHGFRSSFRDWAAEQTSFPREVVEAALAHAIENKVEAAYRRTDLFEKRRQLMDAWATYINGRGCVVPLRVVE